MRNGAVVLSLCVAAFLAACGDSSGVAGMGAPATPDTPAAPGTAPADKFAMANGCYALRSVATGQHAVKSGTGFVANAALAQAESFYLKPTALGKYLFYARDKSLLAATATAVSSTTTLGEPVDFTVERTADGHYSIASASAGKALTTGGDGTLIVAAAPGAFDFAPTTGCTPFPELTDDVVGDTFKGNGVDKPVIGFADAHSHISVNTSFFAGGQWYGDVVNRFGVTEALGNCEAHHGPMGRQDGNNVLQTTPAATHDTVGWPTFASWPGPHLLTHQGAYYKWLERAWKSGLRIITVNGTNIEALCDVARNTNGHALDYTCDDMELAEKQVAYQHDIENYIDAQEGGPGKGWFRVVKTPQEARTVINEGKLAVVPGMEIAHIFNCDLEVMPDGSEKSGCDKAEIDRQVQRIWDLGVRSLIPIHDVDSSLGGAGLFNGNVINLLNFYDTKQFFKTYDCPNGGVGDTYFYEAGVVFDTAVPMTGSDAISSALIAALQGRTPAYPAGKRQCNARGLSDLGKYAIEQIMKKKIMIDIDHMELSIKGDVIAMAKAQTPIYPVRSVHSSFGGLTMQQAKDIYTVGGFIYPYKGNGRSEVDFLKSVKRVMPADALPSLGFGSDINGFGNQADPRGATATAVKYPFTLFSGPGWGPQFAAAGIKPVTFNESQSATGMRKWDVNAEGQAHYGLVADFVEEVRIEGGEEATTALFNSAEQYLRTWEKTINR